MIVREEHRCGKKCIKCKKNKSIKQYLKGKNACKLCRSKYLKKWKIKNREKYNAYSRKYTLRGNKFIINYLKTHPCVDCGNSDIRVLEFDHVRGSKRLEVYALKRYPLIVIEREIAKCEVRCANCHVIKTGIEQGWYRCR